MNATLAGWLDYDLAQFGSGGLKLDDIVPGDGAALLSAVAGGAGEVRTEIHDLDLRRRGGQSLPVRLFHRVAFGYDGTPGASRTLVLNRSAGEDVAEGQRAAEVRFARFFNNTPLAIATVEPARRGSPAPTVPSRGCSARPSSGHDATEPRSILAVVRRARPRGAGGRHRRGRGRAWRHRAGRTGAGRARATARRASSSRPSRTGTERRRGRHRLRARHDRAARAGGAVRPGAEDAGGGPARRRRRARLQQRAAGHHRAMPTCCWSTTGRPIRPSRTSCRSSRTPTAPPAWCGSCWPSRAGRRCARRCCTSARCSPTSRMLLKRLLGERIELDVRHGRDLWPVQGRPHPVRAGDRQPRRQRPRRHAGRRQAHRSAPAT